jgi:hypothetical protein
MSCSQREQSIHSGVPFNSTVASVSSWCDSDQVDLKVMKVGSQSEAPVKVHVIAPPPGPDPGSAPGLGLGPESVLAV